MTSIIGLILDLVTPSRGGDVRRSSADRWQQIETPRSSGDTVMSDLPTSGSPAAASERPPVPSAPRARSEGAAAMLAAPGASANIPLGNSLPQTLPARMMTGSASSVSAVVTGRADPSPSGREAVPPDVSPARTMSQADHSAPVLRRADALERTLGAAGPHLAARELHDGVRALPSCLVGAFLEAARPSLNEAVRRLCAETRAELSTRSPRASTPALIETPERAKNASAPTRRAFVHIAAALDVAAGEKSARRLCEDLATVILAAIPPGDDVVFSALAHGAAIGAGLSLPIAIAEHLGERDEPARSHRLIALLVAALSVLQERIDRAQAELAELTGPLIFDWAGWHEGLDDRTLVARLIAHLDMRPDFLGLFEDRLDQVERVGREAVRALEDLRAIPDARLRDARMPLLEGDATRLAIAVSPAAHREIRRMAGRSLPDGAVLTLDAVRQVFTDIGFTAPRAAFLADAVLAGEDVLPLRSGWTAIDSLAAIDGKGRGFQRLLAILNGRFVVPAIVQTLDFTDVEVSP